MKQQYQICKGHSNSGKIILIIGSKCRKIILMIQSTNWSSELPLWNLNPEDPNSNLSPNSNPNLSPNLDDNALAEDNMIMNQIMITKEHKGPKIYIKYLQETWTIFFSIELQMCNQPKGTFFFKFIKFLVLTLLSIPLLICTRFFKN